MRRLQLQGVAVPATPALSEKEKLIEDIRTFVGDGGRVVFEHGFRPSIVNAWGVTDKELLLRFPVGKKREMRWALDVLDEDFLRKIIVELFRYRNWCETNASTTHE